VGRVENTWWVLCYPHWEQGPAASCIETKREPQVLENMPKSANIETTISKPCKPTRCIQRLHLRIFHKTKHFKKFDQTYALWLAKWLFSPEIFVTVNIIYTNNLLFVVGNQCKVHAQLLHCEKGVLKFI
jgi:hypothetical protein